MFVFENLNVSEDSNIIDLENYCNSPNSFALNTPASQLLRKLQQRVIEKEKIQKQLAIAMMKNAKGPDRPFTMRLLYNAPCGR